LSGSDEAEFLATGLHSDLVTELSRVAGLTIISRSSMMRYQHTDKTAREIGGELNAGTLIEGTVQSVGDRVRLTAQLIDANEDVQRWAERYDRELSTETLFDLQSEVTKKIVDSLQSELAPTLEIPSTKPQTQDMEAYRLSTLGRAQVERRTKAGCLRAIEHFENAVERDPDYAPAWAGLSEALAIAVWYGYLEPGDRLQRAEEAARRAVELDPDSAEAHCALATSLGAVRKGPEALAELELAVRLQPSYWDAHNRLSYLLKLHGRKTESLESATRAVEINPLSAEAVSNLSLSLSTNGDPKRALPEAQRAGELSPGWTTAPLYEALAQYQLGNYAAAVELLTGLTVEWAGLGAQATLAICHLAQGEKSSARQVLASMDRDVDSFAIGLVHLALGEIDTAFERFSEDDYLNDWACLAIHHFYREIWAPVAEDHRYKTLVRRAYHAHHLEPSNTL
jgi:TolB-like protein/tetratricopeptide (TPR) repeat protein